MRTSAIYESVVRHRRFQPMGHELRYGVYSLLLDLDEIDDVTKEIPLFSRNRWNLVSFHDRDHGPRDGSSLRDWFEGHLATAGVDLEGGRIQILVFPRILGYTFNPITVWFGHDRDGDLRAVMYEVHNTFGHAHSHLAIVPKGIGVDDRVPRQGGLQVLPDSNHRVAAARLFVTRFRSTHADDRREQYAGQELSHMAPFRVDG